MSTHQVHMANIVPNVMPYMESLNLPKLNKLINDSIDHDPT